MRNSDARAKLPKGITKRLSGWRIRLGAGGRGFNKSFPPDTPYATVEAAWLAAKRGHDAGHRTAATFAADVTRYLRDYFTGRPGYEERERHLALWTAALGADIDRTHIGRDAVARVLNAWRAQGLAADTCNKRRTALLALYHALDGKGASNPVREIPKFRPPDPLPRGLAYRLIDKAFAQLPRCKTKVRLMVIAYTGIRPGQLMKLTPDHWDHRRHVLTVPGTTKGRGTKPYVVPLAEPARAALKEFDTLNAWGRFTWAPMARMWKAAAMKAKLPEGTVPYDLRHSFGTAIYQATGDLHAARKLLGHSSIRMTERYTLAAVPHQQQIAVRKFGAKVGSPVPKKPKQARKAS